MAGCLFASYLKLLPFFIMVFPGMISRALYPGNGSNITRNWTSSLQQAYLNCNSRYKYSPERWVTLTSLFICLLYAFSLRSCFLLLRIVKTSFLKLVSKRKPKYREFHKVLHCISHLTLIMSTRVVCGGYSARITQKDFLFNRWSSVCHARVMYGSMRLWSGL